MGFHEVDGFRSKALREMFARRTVFQTRIGIWGKILSLLERSPSLPASSIDIKSLMLGLESFIRTQMPLAGKKSRIPCFLESFSEGDF